MGRLATLAAVMLLAAPAGAQDLFFDSAGVRIRYVDRGTGEPVVLLHGNGGSLQGWIDAGIAATLARDYRVIALDARGHGQSGKPRDAAAYGRQMGLDVVRLLDHLGIRRAHMVGYSMGASILGKLVTTHPDRFLTLTMGGSPGRFKFTPAEAARLEREAAEKERECVSRSQMIRLAPTGQPPPTEAAIQTASKACLANPNQDRFALAALHRGFTDLAVTADQVRAIQVPTVAIVGSLDGYVADFKDLQALRPAMRLVVIEGASHGGPKGAMLRPEFLAAVRELIATHPTTRLR
ncbi:MAG: alpha/beta fold hydrolase [Vicinamibacterales bacterium]